MYCCLLGRTERGRIWKTQEVVVYPLGLPYDKSVNRRKVTRKKQRTLYIKNPTAHRLAEKVSKQMGVTLSDAVISALEDTLQRTRLPLNRARLDTLSAALSALPVVDSRSSEEILGYDESGIPRYW
jgi:antitoxin VapB